MMFKSSLSGHSIQHKENTDHGTVTKMQKNKNKIFCLSAPGIRVGESGQSLPIPKLELVSLKWKTVSGC